MGNYYFLFIGNDVAPGIESFHKIMSLKMGAAHGPQQPYIGRCIHVNLNNSSTFDNRHTFSQPQKRIYQQQIVRS